MNAPASIGNTITITDSSSRVLIATERTNCGIRSGFIVFGFVLIVFGMIFTASRMDDNPSRSRENIARSTKAPAMKISIRHTGSCTWRCVAP